MRYFLTTNASRSFSTGGFTFSNFEPVGQRGGSWLGVLAVEDDSAASSLAGAIASGSIVGVDEIPFDRFDALKKKESANSTSSTVSRRNPSPSQPAGASRAGVPTAQPDPNSTAAITAVTLLTGEATPPHESLLEQPAIRRRRGGK